MTAMERVRLALEEHDCRVTGTGGQLAARCPHHDDGSPSLSLTSRDGRALLYCHAGCTTQDVLAALNLTFSDLYDEPLPPRARSAVREHPYQSGDGRLVGVAQRFEPKTFRPLIRNGSGWKQSASEELKTTPYRLPELLAAVDRGETVYVTEGERDADTLAARGITATCNQGGAGKWTEAHAQYLRGIDVVVVRDNDDAGHLHGDQVIRTLADVATSVRLFDVAEGCKDVTDHLTAGHGLEDLREVEANVATPSDPTAEKLPARRVRSRPVAQIPLKRRQYLWDQRLPLGEITLWVGHAGIGKSQAAVWLASQVTKGMLPGELHGTPSPVLYLGTEDSWSYTLAPRFVAAGADLELVRQLYAETDEGETTLSLVVDMDALRAEVAETGARLVVLDALLSTMSSSDLTKQGVVRRVLEPLARLAQELNIAVIGVAHFRKAGDVNPLHMIAGSVEFGQVVRSAIGFAADRDAEDGSCVLSLIKTNISAQGLPSIRYRVEASIVDTPEGRTDVGRFVVLGETDQSVGDLLDQQGGSPDERSERTEAAEWLVSYLADNGGSALSKDILKAAKVDGIAEATLKRARGKARVTSDRRGYQGGSVWTLDPSGSHSAHPDQGTRADPNEPNGDPNEGARGLAPVPPTGTDSQCRDCGNSTALWVLSTRDGRCITCAQNHREAS